MGGPNLKHALERKFAVMAGEFEDKQSQIAQIQGLFDELPVLSRRARHLGHLMNCAEALLLDIDPAWKRAKVKAVRPNVCKGPVPLGDITRSALSILRETEAAMTCRQLAIAVLERHGVTDYDKGVLQRLTNSVNATLRGKDGVLVGANDDWPAKWSIDVRR